MKARLRLLPALYAALLFVLIRIANDMSRSSSYFEAHSVLFVTVELAGVVAASYLSFYLGRRWAMFSTARRVNSVAEYGAVVLFATVLSCAIMLLSHGLQPLRSFAEDLAVPAVTGSLMSLCLYISIKTAIVRSRLERQRLLNQRVRAEKLQAELEVLKDRFHPHFLFNMLNTVYFTISPDNTLARDTVGNLANLLRSQQHNATDNVPLAEEADVLRSYVELARLRLDPESEVRFTISPLPEGATLKPYMLLPLVENTFKHCGYPPEIEIQLKAENGKVILHTENNVPEKFQEKQAGTGIAHLRRRLSLLYPGTHSFHTSTDSNRYTATLILPLCLNDNSPA